MNATQLEALVMQAVDAVRSGASPEDDRIEFKREWPSPEKARQLAAAANQAQGDYIVYVIGVDETDGSVHPTDGTDPASWWQQMEARFDEVPPDLVLHLNVQVSSDERVVGLLFQTDRAPYVVTVRNGGALEREVPIRAGTRTRSAKRHELIRMLYPSMSVPQLTSLSGKMTLYPPMPESIQPRTSVSLSVSTLIYFEHVAPAPIFLPWHTARFTLSSGRFEALGTHQRYVPKNAAPSDAVHVRSDGIRISESGTAPVNAAWSFPGEDLNELQAIESWTMELEFEAAGTNRRAGIAIPLARRQPQRFVDADGTIHEDGSIDWSLSRMT